MRWLGATVPINALWRAQRRRAALGLPPLEAEDEITASARRKRPLQRGDCAQGPRPCPWVSCKHHLLGQISKGGGWRLYRPTDDPAEIPHTCSLDLADRGGMTLEEVGVAMNLTRERVRQVEAMALAKVREAMETQKEESNG